MSTESSAVVRFISLAQKEQQTLGDRAAAIPDLTDDVRPLQRSHKVPLLVLAVFLLVILAGMVGVYVGKNSAAGSARGQARALQPAPAPAAAQATAVPLSTPGPSGAPAAVVPPEVLAETGFDVRVKPHATVSLDGRVLGTAPLRVRNLTPGEHVLDIEAPPGYFSRRVELELDAGEPQNVNLALDAIHPVAVATAGADEPGDQTGDRADKPGGKPGGKRDDRARRGDGKHGHGKAQRAKTGHKARRGEVAAAGRDAGRSSPASAGENGTLMLGSKPPCDIYIDGAATGLKTPQRAIELAAGVHRVTLINSELDIKKIFTVEIEAGRSTRAIHDLTGKI
jgi:hypothetical protein